MARSLGTRREHQVISLLVADGWVCLRAAGSHGPADVVALKRGAPPRCVQVKSDQSGPYKNFGPGERIALVRFAYQAGAEAWLVWWPPRRPCAWIHAAAWPADR